MNGVRLTDGATNRRRIRGAERADARGHARRPANGRRALACRRMATQRSRRMANANAVNSDCVRGLSRDGSGGGVFPHASLGVACNTQIRSRRPCHTLITRAIRSSGSARDTGADSFNALAIAGLALGGLTQNVRPRQRDELHPRLRDAAPLLHPFGDRGRLDLEKLGYGSRAAESFNDNARVHALKFRPA